MRHVALFEDVIWTFIDGVLACVSQPETGSVFSQCVTHDFISVCGGPYGEYKRRPHVSFSVVSNQKLGEKSWIIIIIIISKLSWCGSDVIFCIDRVRKLKKRANGREGERERGIGREREKRERAKYTLKEIGSGQVRSSMGAYAGAPRPPCDGTTSAYIRPLPRQTDAGPVMPISSR